MTTRYTRLISVLLVAALVTTATLGAVSGGALAATTSTGDLAADGTDTITDYTASENRSHTVTYNTSANSKTTDDFEELSLTITHDDHTITDYQISDVAVIDGGNDGTTPLELEFTVNHSDMKTLPGDAGETVPTEYEITERELGVDEGNGTTESFGVDYQFASTHATRTVYRTNETLVTNYESGDTFTARMAAILPGGTTGSTATITDEVGVNGSATDIHVYSESQAITNTFDRTLEDADDGERVATLMTSSVDDQTVYVFAREPGETISGEQVTENDTYIVAHEGGAYDINLGNEIDGRSSVAVSLTSGKEVSASALQADLGYTLLEAWGLGSFDLGDFWPF